MVSAGVSALTAAPPQRQRIDTQIGYPGAPAAVWRLPVVFFCENNGYAEFSPASDQHMASLEQRSAGYGVDYVAVDGNDVVATAAAMTSVIGTARAGRGPVVVEATTYRWHGHYEGDPQRYRSPDEVLEWALSR